MSRTRAHDGISTESEKVVYNLVTNLHEEKIASVAMYVRGKNRCDYLHNCCQKMGLVHAMRSSVPTTKWLTRMQLYLKDWVV